MLTIQEFADLMKVSRTTVYNWIAEGRIKVVRIGGVIRIDQSEVDRITSGE